MINIFSKRSPRVTVLVATRSRLALEVLDAAAGDLDLERREALSTEGLYQELPGAHLVIVDLHGLTESPGMSRDRLAQVLGEGDVAVVDGQAFAQDPQTWLDQARAASGLSSALPARTVAFTGLSGGVGKTTLSLSLAKTFRQETGLTVALIELSSGPSGLLALVGDEEMAHLYEIVTQGRDGPTWGGVTLVPMDWPTARLLDVEQVEAAWHSLQEQHVLTIFDAPAYHPLFPSVDELADQIIAVTDGRPDALASATHLVQQRGHLLLNRAGMAAQLTLDQKPAARLPDVGGSAQNFPPRLGKRLMPVVYPGWK